MALPSAVFAAPAAPTLGLGPIWTNEVDLRWSTPDPIAALTFSVESSTDGVTFAVARSVPHDTTTPVNDLAPGVPYWFRVAASDSTGTSPYSNVVQAATLPCSAALTTTPAIDPSLDLTDATTALRCGTTFDRSLAWTTQRQLDLPPCASGACDLPAVRDATPRQPIVLRVLIHVMRASDGTGGVPSANVDSMVAQINRDFAPHAIQLRTIGTRFHDDSRFATISTGQQMADMKDAYAETPSHNLNVFVTASGLPYDGRGTLPWDPDALTARGGIWLNRNLVDGVHHAASHEVGHCLGLYHTFHGVDELESCGDGCYEFASGADADLRGDLCSDTRATPLNFSCTAPTGCDCAGTPWGTTPLHNIMGYAPFFCVNEFTPQQERRMLCWTNAAIATWIESTAGVDLLAQQGGEPRVWTRGITAPDGSTPVWFTVPAAGPVRLALYDARGRRIATLADGDVSAGRHVSDWDGRDGAGKRVSPGVYWLRIVAGGKSASGGLIVIR
jgi:hypothetical protein